MTKRFRILAVDDEPIDIEVITSALKEDYDIISASSGNQALTQLKEHKPDLILLDVMLPDLNGFDVCKIIKSDATWADVPIIFMTGISTFESELEGLKYGGIDYLTKPVYLPLLKLRVRNHLALKERNDLVKEQRDQLARQRDELARSRDFLAKTERIGKVGGWEFDLDTMEQTWTEEIFRIHEVDMDFKPTVENGINFYAPSSRPIIEESVRLAMKYGEPFDVELEIITAKGNLRNVHAIGKADHAKRRVFGFFQDITERKQAEEAFKNSEERYRQLFEMESDTVLMVDMESFRIIDANSAASRMYGYTREEFLQLTPVDLSNEPAETARSIRDEEAAIALSWHRKLDGTIFPVEIKSSFFVYQGRKVQSAAIRDITEHVQAEKHLLDLNQRLHALSGHLQSVQEQERLAISRDMHDDVGQILTALKLDLGWLEQNIAPDEDAIPLRLKEMHENIDQITTVVQRIAANLRPPLLDDQGLSAAIEWHVGEFCKRSGLECFVMINEDADAIDKEIATVVMRIIQEGLTNILRHARATEASISLCTRDGNLILEITDNGCGITPEQIVAQDAYGLMGMQERARLCNGELEIKGEPGCGTVLRLTIPLYSEERTP